MFLRRRGFWGSLALVTYACMASANASGWKAINLVGVVVVALVFVGAFAATARRESDASPSAASEGAEAGAAAAFTGFAVFGAAALGPRTLGLSALAHLGVGIASVGGAVAVARVPSLTGLLATPPRSQKLDAAILSAFVWSVAVALPLFGAMSIDPGRVSTTVVAFGALFASVASTAVLLVSILRALSLRSLELGIRERLSLPLALGAVCLASAIGASALDLMAPEIALPCATCLIAAFAGLACSARSADAIARGTRLALGVVAPGTAAALTAAYVATMFPWYAAPATVLAAAVAATFGLLAPRIAKRFGPEREAWLATLAAANAAALRADPEPALEQALGALARNGKSLVTLYLVTPPEALTADRAGHVRRERAEVAPSLAALAKEEPEHILRRDALAEAAVRRPDARGALEWMTDRRIELAIAIDEGDDTCAVLAIAETPRTRPWSLEEIRAFRSLGDRLGAVVAVLAKLRRSYERERTLRIEHTAMAGDLAKREGELAARADTLESLLERLARPVRAATYGPAARVVVEQLETWAATGQRGSRITLLTAPGIDAVAWAALFHLAGVAAKDAFVVADGASEIAADLVRWRSETESPLVKARGGTLVLLDPHLLSKLVQGYLGAALGEDTNLVIAVPNALDVLVAREQLEPRFADAAGDRVVVLPTLVERSEDLRALVLGHLATLGMRFHGRPLGIDPEALALLLEHDWPGNDAELVGLLTRALAETTRATLQRSDVARALGASSQRGGWTSLAAGTR